MCFCWWYIKFYDVFFFFFCCFIAAHCATPIKFFERGDLERARHLLATWQDSRWQRIFAWSFFFQDLSTFVQRSHKIYGNHFVIKILMKTQQIFNHDREHMWDTKWMTYPELSFDVIVTDGHGLKWCIKMDKVFVLDYLSPCFIKLGVVWLCIFCVVVQLPESYENKRFVYI